MHELLGYQLAQAAISATAVFDQQVGRPDELRKVEFTLLTLIAENPNVSSARLAKALSVTKPNITMWMDRLTNSKLVERSPSLTDKRSVELKVTSAGSRLVKKATEKLIEGEKAMMHALSAAERAMLIELLHKVARSRPPAD